MSEEVALKERNRDGLAKLEKAGLLPQLLRKGRAVVHPNDHFSDSCNGARGNDLAREAVSWVKDAAGDGISRDVDGVDPELGGRNDPAIIRITPELRERLEARYQIHNETPVLGEDSEGPQRVSYRDVSTRKKDRPEPLDMDVESPEYIPPMKNGVPDEARAFEFEDEFFNSYMVMTHVDAAVASAPAPNNMLFEVMRESDTPEEAFERVNPHAWREVKRFRQRREAAIQRLGGYLHRRESDDVEEDIDEAAEHLVSINRALDEEGRDFRRFSDAFEHMRQPRSTKIFQLTWEGSVDYFIVPRAGGFCSRYLVDAVESSLDETNTTIKEGYAKMVTPEPVDREAFQETFGPRANYMGNAINLDVEVDRTVVG